MRFRPGPLRALAVGCQHMMHALPDSSKLAATHWGLCTHTHSLVHTAHLDCSCPRFCCCLQSWMVGHVRVCCCCCCCWQRGLRLPHARHRQVVVLGRAQRCSCQGSCDSFFWREACDAGAMNCSQPKGLEAGHHCQQIQKLIKAQKQCPASTRLSRKCKRRVCLKGPSRSLSCQQLPEHVTPLNKNGSAFSCSVRRNIGLASHRKACSLQLICHCSRQDSAAKGLTSECCGVQ
jgi:hypothetical protein